MPEETLVVLLCFDGPKGIGHYYYMAKRCRRITPEELGELYTLSQALVQTHAPRPAYGPRSHTYPHTSRSQIAPTGWAGDRNPGELRP